MVRGANAGSSSLMMSSMMPPVHVLWLNVNWSPDPNRTPFPQLVDFHVTRTLARAQWEILGFGPYASLSRERRLEVSQSLVRLSIGP